MLMWLWFTNEKPIILYSCHFQKTYSFFDEINRFLRYLKEGRPYLSVILKLSEPGNIEYKEIFACWFMMHGDSRSNWLSKLPEEQV